MPQRSQRSGGGVVALALLGSAGVAGAGPPSVPTDVLGSQVYYEYASAARTIHGDLPSIRAGQIRLAHYPPFDFSDFDWVTGPSKELTWWIQVEELRFLLPLLASPEPRDHVLAAQVFRRWIEAHEAPAPPNPAAWGEPMSAAYRAMVLTYWVKCELIRERGDATLMHDLRAQLNRHGEFLARHFNADSNHGIVEAFALIELTRVIRRPDWSILGMARLRGMMGSSVSFRGVHLERSPQYHFVVARWISEFSQYLDEVPGIATVDAQYFTGVASRMRASGHYLQDHAGRVAQVGDTDSLGVRSIMPDFRSRRGAGTTFVDPPSGYFVYRGQRGDGRFVLFNASRDFSKTTAHAHDDAMSVVVSIDGEVLLGDAGRYEYANTPRRWFFSGPVAHNRPVAPVWIGMLRKATPRRVTNTWSSVTRNQTTFGAALRLEKTEHTREVRVPRGGAVHVVDHIAQVDSTTRSGAVIMWNFGHDVVRVLDQSADGEDEIRYLIVTRSGAEYEFVVVVTGAGTRSAKQYRGSQNPMVGWYSPRQQVSRPADALALTVTPESAMVVEARLVPVASVPVAGARMWNRGR